MLYESGVPPQGKSLVPKPWFGVVGLLGVESDGRTVVSPAGRFRFRMPLWAAWRIQHFWARWIAYRRLRPLWWRVAWWRGAE